MFSYFLPFQFEIKHCAILLPWKLFLSNEIRSFCTCLFLFRFINRNRNTAQKEYALSMQVIPKCSDKHVHIHMHTHTHARNVHDRIKIKRRRPHSTFLTSSPLSFPWKRRGHNMTSFGVRKRRSVSAAHALHVTWNPDDRRPRNKESCLSKGQKKSRLTFTFRARKIFQYYSPRWK